jgi:hypothetical protein
MMGFDQVVEKCNGRIGHPGYGFTLRPHCLLEVGGI